MTQYLLNTPEVNKSDTVFSVAQSRKNENAVVAQAFIEVKWRLNGTLALPTGRDRTLKGNNGSQMK